MDQVRTRSRLTSAVLALALLLALPLRSVAAQTDSSSRDLVVLVHGMGRTPLSMLSMARALEKDGFEVYNWGYSSYCCTIAQIGDDLAGDLAARLNGRPRRIHFVGHSLGNIVIRWLLTRADRPDSVGHVVMLAPPNQGSRSADRYSRLFGWALVPMRELRTDTNSTARTLPSVRNVRIGIIAGEFDGKVSVDESQLAEAAEHRVVPATHSFLAMRGDVQALVIGFLRRGRFPE